VDRRTIRLPNHCQILRSSLMSYGVAVNTRLVGAVYGDFLDDLTDRMSFPTSRLVLLL
jgi:hypothetical protein